MSENKLKASSLLPPRLREVRDVFDLSASDNLSAPSLPILFSILSENQLKNQVFTTKTKCI